MDSRQLKILLREGEGQYLEFKENLSDIARHLVAFTNANGGRLLVGVTDKGEIKGFEATNRIKAQIQDIARHCDPRIEVSIKTVDKIIIISVLEGINKPYQCKEGFFLRNGAVLFFSKEPQRFFKDTYTTCVRYQGGDNDKIIDRRDIYGDLISQAEEILKFISKNTMLEYVITGSPERVEKSEYPAEALREAVLNALMHRDYFIEGANVFVGIFDDRIEITKKEVLWAR